MYGATVAASAPRPWSYCGGGIAAGRVADVAALAITNEQPAARADVPADGVQRPPAVHAERLEKREVRFKGARHVGGGVHDGPAERGGGIGGREVPERRGQPVGIGVQANAERGAGSTLGGSEAVGKRKHGQTR